MYDPENMIHHPDTIHESTKENIVAKAQDLADAIEEIKELKELFEQIKSDTEELIRRSLALSEAGAEEASELVDAVKSNWEKAMTNFAAGGLAELFSGGGKGKSGGKSKKSSSKKASRGDEKKSSQSTTKKSAQDTTKKSAKDDGKKSGAKKSGKGGTKKSAPKKK